jgi:hypothetical protein
MKGIRGMHFMDPSDTFSFYSHNNLSSRGAIALSDALPSLINLTFIDIR